MFSVKFSAVLSHEYNYLNTQIVLFRIMAHSDIIFVCNKLCLQHKPTRKI